MNSFPMDWVPDLLAFLWRSLAKYAPELVAKERVVPGHVPARVTSRAPAEEARLRDEIAAAPGGEVPKLVADYLRGVPFAGLLTDTPIHDVLWRRWIVARCIDDVLAGAHPRRWAVSNASPHLRPGACERAVWRHYRLTGRYNRTAPGILVPRSPLACFLPDPEPPPPSRIDDLFHTFAYLPPSTDDAWTVVHRRLAWRDDPVPPDRLTEIRVATVPWAEDPTSLEPNTRIDGAGEPRIRFTPEPGLSGPGTPGAERAKLLIEALGADGATIAVFPELALSQADVRTLSTALASATTGPAIIVAGSCLSEVLGSSGAPYNECIVLGRSGRDLWTQRKLNRAEMTLEQLDWYGLSHLRAADAPHAEDFHPGGELLVVDGSLGRMMVLICEDLQRPTPRNTALERLRPDWIFSPVLDGSLRFGRWSQRRAWEINEVHGARVVVANSLALSLREPPSVEQPVVGMLLDPGGWTDDGDAALSVSLPGSRAHSLCVDPATRGLVPLFASSNWSPRDWEKPWIVPGGSAGP